MPNEILSGGLLFIVAAGLWLAYLLPTWVKRREYLATERNTLRLQQTLRIMAETAELPEEVRVSLNSKEVVAKQRALRAKQQAQQREQALELHAYEQQQLAVLRARKAARARQVRSELQVANAAAELQRRRIRRTRLISAVFVLVGLVTAIFAGLQLAVIPAMGWLLAAGVVVAAAGSLLLRQLAVVSKAMRRQRVQYAAKPAVQLNLFEQDSPKFELPIAPRQVDRTWQPARIPRPQYQTRATANLVSSGSDLKAKLLQDAKQAEQKLRTAEQQLPSIQPSVAAETAQRPEAATANSGQAQDERSLRFARMGVIDQITPGFDVDQVLNRRRNAS